MCDFILFLTLRVKPPAPTSVSQGCRPKSNVAIKTNGGAPFPGPAHKKTGRCHVFKEGQDVGN